MPLSEGTKDNGDNDDDLLPMDSIATSLSPLERALSVAEFTSYFKSIGEYLCLGL